MDNYHGWSWKGIEVRGIENNGHIDGDRMDSHQEVTDSHKAKIGDPGSQEVRTMMTNSNLEEKS